MEVYGWPSSATGRLGPEITSASRKIISICLGEQSWPAGASAYRNRRLQPSPVSAQAHLDLSEVRTTSICPPNLGEGCPSQQAGDSACVVRGGDFLCEGCSLRTLGNPGRFLEMLILAAAQGVCGNDTARAAEIPPLLTLAGKWSSSSGTINGDRSLHGAGGQHARTRGWGEGQCGQQGVGAPMAKVKKQTAKGHSWVAWIHNCTERHHKESRLTTLVLDTSHNTAKCLVCMDS